jgi:tRNA threonylcarbamoyl adenosine modification protein YeaZ
MILALDTSGDELLVALVEDGRMVAGAVHPGRRHQDRIRSVIADVAGDVLAGIDAVAVARGPGSHTGLRVGLSTAAGLAFGRHLPIYPLSSLAVAAQRTVNAGVAAGARDVAGGGAAGKDGLGSREARVVAVVFAGRGRVYSQEFACEGVRRTPSGPRRLIAIGEIEAGDASFAAEPALLAQLFGGAQGDVRGGAEALAAAVNQAVGAKEAVNYDQLTGDYGD